jgi:hypothetical protein
MRELILQPQTADAVHALLPLVPDKGSTRLEDRWKQAQVFLLRVGRGPRLLEVLSLVLHHDPTLAPTLREA